MLLIQIYIQQSTESWTTPGIQSWNNCHVLCFEKVGTNNWISSINKILINSKVFLSEIFFYFRISLPVMEQFSELEIFELFYINIYEITLHFLLLTWLWRPVRIGRGTNNCNTRRNRSGSCLCCSSYILKHLPLAWVRWVLLDMLSHSNLWCSRWLCSNYLHITNTWTKNIIIIMPAMN